jgi:hypothetical protein
MRHYTESVDHRVAPRAAKQCKEQCRYEPARPGTTMDPRCKQRCVDAYKACIKASKNPSKDFNCPTSELKCQDKCYR